VKYGTPHVVWDTKLSSPQQIWVKAKSCQAATLTGIHLIKIVYIKDDGEVVTVNVDREKTYSFSECSSQIDLGFNRRPTKDEVDVVAEAFSKKYDSHKERLEHEAHAKLESLVAETLAED
jgi:hypothetical protein